MVKIEYDVIHTMYIDQLRQEINEAIRNGWWPVGGVNHSFGWSQAMTRVLP